MSTRYATPFSFDHGTDTFTARTKKFKPFLIPHIESGLIAEWSCKVINFELEKKVSKCLWFEPHLVASHNMNSLCKKIAENLNVKLNTEVAPLSEREADGWHLWDKNALPLGVYDAVISTAPPEQTVCLLEGRLLKDTPLHHAQMQSCYFLMIGFKHPWEHQWIASKAQDNPIKWVSINSTKPGRSKDLTCIVAYSNNN